MRETELNPLPQEVIGMPKDGIGHIESLLRDVRTKYKECLAPVIIERGKIDPRILKFENELHQLNRSRANSYDRAYNYPEIIYVDRVQAIERSTEINGAITRAGLELLGHFDQNAASYQSVGNYIVLFVNNFDDKDMDSWDACRKIRHELSHAGSVRKHRVYQSENARFDYWGYRVGARFVSKKQSAVPLSRGLAIDEGHRTIEDDIFEGRHPELLKQDKYIKRLPNGPGMFPGVQQKYEQLRKRAIQRGEVRQDQMLMTYRKDKGLNLVAKAYLYEDFARLMKLIYQKRPQLFGSFCDFIYGDRMIAFAKEIEQLFGKGYFQKLMAIENAEAARKLTRELFGVQSDSSETA